MINNRNTSFKNVIIKNIMIIFFIITIALLFECLVLNYRYFVSSETGINSLKDSDLDLNNIVYNNIEYNGENEEVSIVINQNSDILSLVFTIEPKSSPFEITVVNLESGKADSKINLADPIFNNKVVINTEKNNGKIKLLFNEYMNENCDKKISIQNLQIDNQFNFNLRRFGVLLSFLLIIGLLLLNREFFKKIYISLFY